MSTLADSFVAWLGDYYLLSTVLLGLAIAAGLSLQQPVQRLTVAKSAIAALFLLAAMCTLPGWSLVHLLAEGPRAERNSASEANVPAVEQPRTAYSGPSTKAVEASEVESAPRAATDPAVAAATREMPFTWKSAVSALYLLGAGCVVAWLTLGSLAAYRLRNGSQLAASSMRELLNEILATDAEKSHVELRTSDRIDVPVALGIRRPMILLPARWAQQSPLPFREGQGEGSFSSPLPPREGPGEGSSNSFASTTDLRTVLAHEAAHIRNRDLHWLAASRALLILLWAQPLYWFLRRRMRLEQETLADAAAAEITSRQRYAEQLVMWARTLTTQSPMRLSSAVGLWESPSQLRRRVALLLDDQFTILCRCTNSCRIGAPVLAVAFAFVLSTITLQPAIQGGETSVHSAIEAQLPVDDGKRPSPKNKPYEEQAYSIPIRVTGLALDEKNEPIAGARIYLASPRTSGNPLATTVSDNSGRYRFDSVQLPIKPKLGKEDVGSFEVFGEANGYGLAWRPLKWFYPKIAHAHRSPIRDSGWDLPGSYGTEDPIELHLHFGRENHLRGRIVNDAGEPISGTVLAIRGAQPVNDDRDRHNFESLNSTSLVPESIKLRRTDKDGRFEFAALPADHRFRIDVRPPGYTERIIYAATQRGRQKDVDGTPVYANDFKAVFNRPRTVKLRVLYGDTGQPAAKVGVGGKITEAGFWVTTDKKGIVDVPLPDGEFELGLLPCYRTPYLRTQARVVVTAHSANKTTTLTLNPAAVVYIRVVDADTNKPLPAVDVWIDEAIQGGTESYRQVHGYRSWEVETRISHFDSPKSDENGSMQVFFPPGKRRVGVGLETFPNGYVPVEPNGKVLELEAGKPRSVEFKLRRSSATSGAVNGKDDATGDLRVIQAGHQASKAVDIKERPPALLSYDDGKPDGKKSYGGSGHLIEFTMPEGVDKVRGIRIHGSRYGLAQAPDEKFEITFLDEAGEDILHSDAVPYHLFKRGKEQWVRVMFDKEVELPQKFWVSLNFNPTQTKGVYLSYDTSTKGEHSRVGLPGDEEEPKPTDFDGDWMVQLMLAKPK